MDSDDRTIGPSGICRAGRHEWQHDTPGSHRRVCAHCNSMMTGPCDCEECTPSLPDVSPG